MRYIFAPYIRVKRGRNMPRRDGAAAGIISDGELCLVTLAFNTPGAPAIAVDSTLIINLDRAIDPEFQAVAWRIERHLEGRHVNSLALSVAQPPCCDEGRARNRLQCEKLVGAIWGLTIRTVTPAHVALWSRKTRPTLPGPRFLGLGRQKHNLQVQAIEAAAFSAFTRPRPMAVSGGAGLK